MVICSFFTMKYCTSHMILLYLSIILYSCIILFHRTHLIYPGYTDRRNISLINWNLCDGHYRYFFHLFGGFNSARSHPSLITPMFTIIFIRWLRRRLLHTYICNDWFDCLRCASCIWCTPNTTEFLMESTFSLHGEYSIFHKIPTHRFLVWLRTLGDVRYFKTQHTVIYPYNEMSILYNQKDVISKLTTYSLCIKTKLDNLMRWIHPDTRWNYRLKSYPFHKNTNMSTCTSSYDL